MKRMLQVDCDKWKELVSKNIRASQHPYSHPLIRRATFFLGQVVTVGVLDSFGLMVLVYGQQYGGDETRNGYNQTQGRERRCVWNNGVN